MCLKAVFSVGDLWYAVGEGYVGAVELGPHVIGRGAQQNLDLIPQLVGGGSLALGLQDIVIGELGPGLW